MKTASLAEARVAKEKLSKAMGARPEVNGVGITRVRKGYAVKLNLSEDMVGEQLPEEIDGVPVHIEVVGPISKRSSDA